jgi:xanthine dehydrogenase accessory factor
MQALERALEVVRNGASCVLVTVVAQEGSAPRGPGAMVLVESDGSRTGTIGGGEPEAAAVAAATELLAAAAQPCLVELSSGCGGQITVFLQRLEPSRRLVVVGAGNVGAKVVEIAAAAGFEVTVIDRSGGAAVEHIAGVRCVTSDDPDSLAEIPAPEAVQVIVATSGHADDIRWALAAATGGFAGVGVLGSRAKADAVFREAARQGVASDRVRCPVGLDLGGGSPAEIAVSIVAELVRLGQMGEVPDSWRKSSRA